MKLPGCSVYYTPLDGDYDCDSAHSVDCESCLVNYFNTGGLVNPDTGKKVNKLIAFIVYGNPMKNHNIKKVVDFKFNFNVKKL